MDWRRWLAPKGYVVEELHLSFDDATVCALCGRKEPCACYQPPHRCDDCPCEEGDCPCCEDGLCTCEPADEV